jgi:hypothetical protein
LELTNADVPISINVATGASLPALVGDPDLNINDGAFDLELATFNVSEVTISDIVNTFPIISKANNQLRRATAYSINDMVLCQSASDSLIFICTTAGTTAIQEPSAYASASDGSSVTDGTAIFKAYSLAGQITKLSKTEDLISNSGDAYSPSKAYAVGDLCIYNNVLYRCITACSAGSWATNQSCFTVDSLTNVVAVLNSDLKVQELSVSPTPINSRVTINDSTFYKIGKLCIADIIFTTNQSISGTSSNPISLFNGLPAPISNTHINATFRNGETAQCVLYPNGNFASESPISSSITCYLHYAYALP